MPLRRCRFDRVRRGAMAGGPGRPGRSRPAPLLLLGALLGCEGAVLGDLGTAGGPGAAGEAAPARANGPGPGAGVRDPGGTGGAGPAAGACASRPLLADEAPVRLLTREQYNNTLAHLFGDTSAPMTLVPGAGGDGFDTHAEGLVASERLVEFYRDAAGPIARRALPAALREACPSGPGEADCPRSFVSRWGRRIFRRPLEARETAALVALHDRLRSPEIGEAPADALAGVLEAMLQMPAFLYRVETGTPAAGGLARLSGWEMASRLSFLLWNSTPDDALLSAAAAGRLDDAAGVRAQAERLLDHPRARPAIGHFHAQWLGIDQLEDLTRDPRRYPEYGPELGRAMREGTLRFLADLMAGGGGVADVYRSDHAWVDEGLARIYGVSARPGRELVRVTVGPPQRSGLLTHPSVLTAHSKSTHSSPIARGVFVVRRLLCLDLGDPPPDVEPLPEKLVRGSTLRQQLEAHSQNPCAYCHRLIDPPGLTLEAYDAVGRFRTRDEAGNAVETASVLRTASGEVPVRDAIELSSVLARSREAAACLLRQWYRYAVARVPDRPADACTLERLAAQLEPGGWRLRDLVLAVVTSDLFRHRTVHPVEACR